MRLLLISNSKAYDKGYLGHCSDEIQGFLGPIKSVLFIPYAIKDIEWYEDAAKKKFSAMGLNLTSIHRFSDPVKAIEDAQSLFVGGGNTFRLLNTLYEKKLIKLIRKRVIGGLPFIGSSAGSNMACPTIKTTNDMPIIQPLSFDALNLVSFQINPHYIDPDPNSKHMGETRDQRIKEFHEENDVPVVGLREGAWIRVENGKSTLGGTTGAKLFEKGKEPSELHTGYNIVK